MLKLLNKNLLRFFSHLGWPIRKTHSKCKVLIKKLGHRRTKPHNDPDAKYEPSTNFSSSVHPNAQLGTPKAKKPIRIATFNAALHYVTLPKAEKKAATFNDENGVAMKNRTPFDLNSRSKSSNTHPKSILKQYSMYPNRADTLSKFGKSEVRVSINLPDNEISLRRKRQLSFSENEKEGCLRGREEMMMRESYSGINWSGVNERSGKRVVEVLRELDADILGLQDVKAEEENGMKPLSELAEALGMNYVFAESWAPQYGNAVLSRWPIKRWTAHKVDHNDFRNVLKATIDVPQEGELNFYCTQLDHLDENWRMKQINAIIQSNEEPHILAGGLNSLDESDYSQERWRDIVKYYEEIKKPTPQVDVMKYLKSKNYSDAKDFAGECESVVMIAKGQSVQGTCKYGTRVDYILSSSNSLYKFVPGSYLVHSSKGTSDHHIVKVDVVKANINPQENVTKIPQRHRQKVVRITHSSPSKGFIYVCHSYLAPEYLLHGIVDEKTDVFAFGVLLLELVSGRRALDYSQQSLVLWAKPLLKKNDIKELIDPSLADEFDSRQMNLMVLAASLCIQNSSIRRPSMRQVVQLLNGNLSCFKGMKKTRLPFFRKVFQEELLDCE